MSLGIECIFYVEAQIEHDCEHLQTDIPLHT